MRMTDRFSRVAAFRLPALDVPAAGRWLAASALASTLLLVAMGGIVRATGHGLGCPDWPLCYGRVIPPALTGAWVEFTHRLLGAFAALQILLLGAVAWRRRRDPAQPAWPALAAVAILALQVPLGGLHVVLEIPPQTGLVHTVAAMLIVGLLAWHLAAGRPARAQSAERPRYLGAWLGITAIASLILVVSGSWVTRSGASLACPDFPACGAPEVVSRALVHFQVMHRSLALGVALFLAVALAWLWRSGAGNGFRGLALGLAVLLLLQGGLGAANVLLRLPIWSRVLHLAVAATLWAGLVFLWGSYTTREVRR